MTIKLTFVGKLFDHLCPIGLTLFLVLNFNLNVIIFAEKPLFVIVYTYITVTCQ